MSIMQHGELSHLISSALAGNHAAFGAIVKRYQQSLFSFLGRMGMPQAQAEDIAQEAFIKAWCHLPSFDAKRAQFSTWLFAIARNLALNELASAKNLQEIYADEALSEHESQDIPAADVLIEKQRHVALQQALRKLPSEDRAALALAYVTELDLAAISRIEHCSLAAIKTRIHRAKLKLRDLLKETL
jgi:RNA polymerase sigma-70 factor, ECF subfamily